jgi:acetyl esterase/lipase
MCISGWFDMSAAGDSYDANDASDPFFKRETVRWLGGQVAKERDPASPDLSPLYADLAGLPPLYLQVGADETLLDDSRLLAERARAQGVEVMLDIFPDMLHSFQMMAGRAPEADHAIAKLASWARRALDR